MNKLIIWESVTLDGVMQSPARPDEDTRGGFPYGGWGVPYADPISGQIAGEGMSKEGGALLFGRRTYEDLYSVWPKRKDGNPFTPVLNNRQKYVASKTLKEPLPWMNSTLLKGDVAQAVATLKAQVDGDIMVLGSGDLVQTLMKHNLIDEYILLITPIVFGTGRRLFPEGAAHIALKLVDSKTTTTGVIIATYQPS